MIGDRMTFPIISVIMPVYNSRAYLEMAIQSVLNQSFKEFELLLVDDGSNDGSEELCDKYLYLDERVRVIHKENGGVCSARNVGIKNSGGQYIAFIDNDDMYKKEFLETLLKYIREMDADIVKCGRRNVKILPDLKIISDKNSFYPETVFLEFEEFSRQYCKLRKGDILSSVWNGLYKREIIKKYKLIFDEMIRYGNEDIIFNSDYMIHCKKIVLLKDVLYTHFYRMEHSTSMKFSEEQISTRILAVHKEMRIVQKVPKMVDMLMLEGIRELFRLIVPVNNRKQRIKYIKQIKKALDFDILNKLALINDKSISCTAKIDLLLIKFQLYDLYFALRRMCRFPQ
ncbi:MAG: glycosyltransferase [Enterocloster asparagiformis]|nr:glycosyltransferase [Enterocloster asparagiformis]